jgi:hypothetical protein
LDSEFKLIDGAHLPNEYTELLKRTHNPSIDRPMVKKIVSEGQTDCYIYYGQVDTKGQLDGIGTMLFENGFCYQGMFEKGNREGLGITYDKAGNKYKGEHREGMRQGRGKIVFSDGNVYTGGWNKNKKHGRGCERYI